VASTAARLTALAGADAEVADRTVSVRVPRAGTELPGLLRSLDSDGVALESIEVRRPTLDDVFLELTGRSLREHA
jgi:ABC-2 type transport system ATP-binding protein